MKLAHVFLIILLVPVQMIAQWSFEWDGSDFQLQAITAGDSAVKDVEYHLVLQNPSSEQVNLKWRIMENDFPSPAWEDAVCDYVCYAPSERAKELSIDAQYDFPISFHLYLSVAVGFGTSKLCFFDPLDSANTLQCITARVTTSPTEITDTIEVESQGSTYAIVAGAVYFESAAYPNSSTLIAGGEQFIVINGDLFWFKSGTYKLYEDVIVVHKGGEMLYLIEGGAYTFDGAAYNFIATAEDDKVDGKDVYIIAGDTFEFFGDDLVPLAVNNIAAASSALYQNTPNPFKGSTIVRYDLIGGSGALKVYDLTGKLVKEIALTSGSGQLTLGQDLNEGMYFYSLWSDGELIANKRMSVLK